VKMTTDCKKAWTMTQSGLPCIKEPYQKIISTQQIIPTVTKR